MKEKFKIYREFSPEIPKLFHYTSHAGMLGLINNKKLWFTNIHYMNDATEYSYSLELIKTIIKKLYDFSEEEKFLRILPNGKDIEPIFSFSLSANGDLLSQWRGYCPNGGYSVSFFNETNYGQLDDMMLGNNLYIGECLYDIEKIEEFVKEKIVGLSPKQYTEEKDAAINRGEINHWFNNLYVRVVNSILMYAPLIKHEAFKEEKEWRIVANNAESRVIPRAPKNIRVESVGSDGYRVSFDPSTEYIPFENLYGRLKFRQGKNFLIPYLEIPLADENPIYIDEVIIGPTPHEELSIQACQLLIKNRAARITASSLPYRNW